MRTPVASALVSLVLTALAACATTGTGPIASTGPGPAGGTVAVAALEPRSGSGLSGAATFTVNPKGGVSVHLDVTGATPGRHGVHLHQMGDCSDPTAASAGGHFNPAGAPHHGGLTTPVRHGGDLGNLSVGKDGKGVLDVQAAGITLDGAADGVSGRSIVVHEKADDLESDPAGDSGARIACGAIR